jgi:branched-chain amino acid transport system ATP-binding protein
MAELLAVEGLTAGYGDATVLEDVALSLEEGDSLALLGRNGMGKTTTINSIMGIIKPMRGEVRFADQVITGAPSFRIARMGLGLVPEGRQVFPNLTVSENLIATAANRGNDTTPWTVERIFEMFPNLASRRNSMGNLLSGGEQQMLAVARARMTNPKLLILDEATEGLAPLIRAEIWDCLRKIRDDGLSILVVDKNIVELGKLASRYYVLEKGAVAWKGTAQEFSTAKDVRQRFLGV